MQLLRGHLIIALTALAAAAACGADGAGDDDVGDDGGVGPDAEASGCDIGVQFMPTSPTVGDTVVATSSVPVAESFLEYSWSVQRGASDVPFTLAASGGERIMFETTAAGAHFVRLTVSGSPCLPFDGAVNVGVPGATDVPWRLRFTAAPGTGAPAQERIVVVPSGADFDYGTVALDPGATTTGTLVDSLGVATSGYLRLTPAGTPDLVIDGFAGSSGQFALTSTLELHDLLVIPFRPDLAPLIRRDWTPISGAVIVDAGTAVSGVVLAPSGAGVVGATVTLRVDGVPSTPGLTTAGGAFTVRARPAAGALVTVDVVPPAGSGLPRLLSSAAVLNLAASIDVTYQATLDSQDVGGAAVTLGGAPALNAQVTFVGTIATAAVVATGLTQAPASGSFAVAVLANGAGVLPSALVPAAPTSAVVAGTGVVAVDLTTVAPAAIAAPGAAALTGRVVDPDQTAVAAADLRAVPTGALAAAGAAEVHVVAGSDGTFGFSLAGGGAYDLVIVDRSGGLALSRSPLAVSGPAALGDLPLLDGLRLSGKTSLAGGTATGVAVTVFCEDCSAAAQTRPAGEAVTDLGGRYRATVVDPGVE